MLLSPVMDHQQRFPWIVGSQVLQGCCERIIPPRGPDVVVALPGAVGMVISRGDIGASRRQNTTARSTTVDFPRCRELQLSRLLNEQLL
jgi:hypothetical protein